jgi:hypothetical protein
MDKKFNEKDHVHHVITIKELLYRWLDSIIPKKKTPFVDSDANLVRKNPPGMHINYLAIVVDEEVKEIIRAEDEMASIMLSKPKVVQFDPTLQAVKIGTRFVRGKFVEDK